MSIPTLLSHVPPFLIPDQPQRLFRTRTARGLAGVKPACRQALSGLVILLCLSMTAQAAGFAVSEQSVSAMGTALAGASVTAEDASVMFFNPAGLAGLSATQIVIAMGALNVETRFRDDGSRMPAALALASAPGGAGNSGGVFLVPAFYFSSPVSERVAVGLGVNSPFGLSTEWHADWVGRFQGILSKLATVNINPAVAVKIQEGFWMGAGLNYQRARSDTTNAVVLGINTEGRARRDLSGEAWGWNLGTLYVTKRARIGLSYRSKLRFAFNGDLAVTSMTGVPVPGLGGPVEAVVTFPEMASAGVALALSEKLELLGDLTFTRWSRVDHVDTTDASTQTVVDRLDLNFRNAIRVSIGTRYRAAEKWTLRAGLAIDESPVGHEHRTVQIPDSNRYWLTFGGGYKLTRRVVIDFAYAHVFFASAPINKTAPPAAPPGISSTVLGGFRSRADIVSLQLTHRF